MVRKLLIISVIILAASGHAFADPVGPGENFFGYWQWRTPGNPARNNPRDACIDLMAYFNSHGTPATYVGTSATGAPSGRDYTCKWKHTDTNVPDQSINSAQANYVCPSNATAHTLHNSGIAADFRCTCNSGSCYSPSPPSPEVSARCTQRKDFNNRNGADPSVPDPEQASLQNMTLARSGRDGKAFYKEYSTIANELKATEDCEFEPEDFAPIGGDINIGYLCGSRGGDEGAANNMIGLNSTPAGYVWHHGLDMGSMQLVTKAAHNRCGAHTGGVAVWKEAVGIIDYPLNLPPLY